MKQIEVSFKSNPENYAKEESGLKCNTVRVVGPDDPRFYLLNEKKATIIKIVNSETGAFFTRRITDITFWNGEFIISWAHFRHRKRRKAGACQDVHRQESPNPSGEAVASSLPIGKKEGE